MHRMADEIAAARAIPLLHIADPTAERIRRPASAASACSAPPSPWSRTSTRAGWSSAIGLEVLVPEEADRAVVHRIIYDELVAGMRRRRLARGLPRGHRAAGRRGAAGDHPGLHGDHAAGRPQDSLVPLFDTTELHARLRWMWRWGVRRGA